MKKVILGLMFGLLALAPMGAGTVSAQADPAYVSPNKAGGTFSIVPCGRHADNPKTTENETDPCSICHLVVLGNNIVKYLLYIGVFVAFAVLVAAGVMYIVSTGDEGFITSAKNAMKYALGGLIAMFVGWVVINTLITMLLPVNVSGQSGLKGGWFGYTCGGGVSENSGTVTTPGGPNSGNQNTPGGSGQGTPSGPSNPNTPGGPGTIGP